MCCFAFCFEFWWSLELLGIEVGVVVPEFSMSFEFLWISGVFFFPVFWMVVIIVSGVCTGHQVW